MMHQPLGKLGIPSKYLESVKNALEETYGLNIDIAPPIPLPDAAYYRPRNRYRAPVIIDNIKNIPGNERLIGLTHVDISQPEKPYDDWGVIGVAQLKGRCSVISFYRLGSGDEMPRRLKKVSVHEYGHLLGFDHCADEQCTMSDIRGSVKNLDKIKYGYFCKEHVYQNFNTSDESFSDVLDPRCKSKKGMLPVVSRVFVTIAKKKGII
jgi:archaemetzincin